MMSERISSGNSDLDHLLGGGFEPQTLTQFYGEPASGKSTVCLLTAATCLRNGDSVVYIDTEGFSTERFRQVAGEDCESLAERLFLFEPLDFDHQGLIVSEVNKVLKNHPCRLLVMDSATALYRTDLEKGRDALQTLTKQMLHLLGYARRFSLSVLVTNQVYMDPTNKNKFLGLGGTALEHLSKTIVNFERLDEPGLRRARLVKHRSRPEGASFVFEITETGIRVR